MNFVTRPFVRASSGFRGHRRLIILAYHRVNETLDPTWPWEVDRATFRSQVKFLSENCRLMTLSDAALRLKGGNLPAGSACITFDDGYADNHDVAAEELRKFQAPATFFIATGYVNGGIMWNDRIVEAFRQFCPGKIVLDNVGEYQIGPNSDRSKFALDAIKKIRYRNFDEREKISIEIMQHSEIECPKNLMMTDSMIKSLHDSGMEIGAHTVSHPILAEQNEQEAKEEIERSKAYLEQVIGTRVSSFAYPNGRFRKDFSARDVGLVHSAGFDAAVATNWGAATTNSHLLVLPRIGVFGEKQLNIAFQLCKSYRSLSKLDLASDVEMTDQIASCDA